LPGIDADNGVVPPVRRAILILTLWGAATAFGLAFAVWTHVGPVLLVFTRRHGVHVGDLVALGAAYAVAALLTHRILRTA